MKIPLSVLLVMYCLFSKAQTITTRESEETFLSGTRNAVTTTIYGNNLTDVITGWENFLKKYKYEIVSDNKNEVYGHNLFFKDIINRPVDIYSKFDEKKEEKIIHMSTALDIGASNYLKSESNPAEIKTLEKMIKDFATQMTKAPLEEYLKAAINYQEKLKGEIKSLEKSKKKLEEDLSGYKIKTGKTENQLAQKNSLLETKKTEVIEQKKILDTCSVKGSAWEKSSKKLHEKLLGQQNDLENNIKELQTDITDLQAKTTAAEKNIKANTEQQISSAKEIETQKLIAEKWQQKLDKVR